MRNVEDVERSMHIFLEGMMKTTKYLSHGSQPPWWESNLGLQKYETGEL